MFRFSQLTHLFRSSPKIDPGDLEAYATVVTPPLNALSALFDRWRRSLEVDSRDHLLADASSIQRWEAAALRDRLRALTPPAGLRDSHAELISIATTTARASQLLSSGYRFHSSRARCDGHALLLTAEERYAAVRTRLLRHGLVIELSTDPAESSPPPP